MISIAPNVTHVGLVFNPTYKIKYMKKHLIKFLEIALGYNEEESLISKEGYEILADPIKRAKLRQWIEMYKETGEWDFGFWDESKDEKLSQHDVSGQSEQLVCKGKCDWGYTDGDGNELFCSIKKK